MRGAQRGAQRPGMADYWRLKLLTIQVMKFLNAVTCTFSFAGNRICVLIAGSYSRVCQMRTVKKTPDAIAMQVAPPDES